MGSKKVSCNSAARSANGLQSLMNIAEHDAACQRYIFSESKTKIVPSNTKTQVESILLNGKPLGFSQQETHLGLDRTANCSYATTVSSRIKTARKTLYSLVGADLHGLNGSDPTTSINALDRHICHAYDDLRIGMRPCVIKRPTASGTLFQTSP